MKLTKEIAGKTINYFLDPDSLFDRLLIRRLKKRGYKEVSEE